MAERKKSTLKYSEPSNYFPKEVRQMFEKDAKKTAKKKAVKGTKKKK